jgi:hypothetical protein
MAGISYIWHIQLPLSVFTHNNTFFTALQLVDSAWTSHLAFSYRRGSAGSSHIPLPRKPAPGSLRRHLVAVSHLGALR